VADEQREDQEKYVNIWCLVLLDIPQKYLIKEFAIPEKDSMN
jgi:hypothetical protein